MSLLSNRENPLERLVLVFKLSRWWRKNYVRSISPSRTPRGAVLNGTTLAKMLMFLAVDPYVSETQTVFF